MMRMKYVQFFVTSPRPFMLGSSYRGGLRIDTVLLSDN
jgi:hypothetical protein